MMKEQQVQVRKLQEQQCIMPIAKQPSTYTRIAALEAWLGIKFQPKEGVAKKQRERFPKNQHGGEKRNSVVTYQASDAKCKELN